MLKTLLSERVYGSIQTQSYIPFDGDVEAEAEKGLINTVETSSGQWLGYLVARTILAWFCALAFASAAAMGFTLVTLFWPYSFKFYTAIGVSVCCGLVSLVIISVLGVILIRWLGVIAMYPHKIRITPLVLRVPGGEGRDVGVQMHLFQSGTLPMLHTEQMESSEIVPDFVRCECQESSGFGTVLVRFERMRTFARQHNMIGRVLGMNLYIIVIEARAAQSLIATSLSVKENYAELTDRFVSKFAQLVIHMQIPHQWYVSVQTSTALYAAVTVCEYRAVVASREKYFNNLN